MEEHALKDINSCWNAKITFYLETSGANVMKLSKSVIYEFS
jgi:hypothetical protein